MEEAIDQNLVRPQLQLQLKILTENLTNDF